MKLERLMALVMSVVFTIASYPVHVAAQVGLRISGTVVESDRTTPHANSCVRLRKVDTNAIVARAMSDRSGAFSFSVPEPGMYVAEAVDCPDGSVLAVSESVTLAQSPLTTLVVLPTAAAPTASSTALVVVAAAAAAGITAVYLQGPTPINVLSPEQ